MIRKWILGALLLSVSAFSQAGVISFETLINGADMEGMNVTVTFGDNIETFVWGASSATQGGVSGSDWSLSQEGYTFGDVDGDGTVYGAWTFTDNTNDGISKLEISAVGTRTVFDTLAEPNGNGSGPGRSVFAFIGEQEYLGFSVVYVDHFFDELYAGVVLSLDNPGTSFQFFADTDAIVPEPSILLIFASGLLGLVGIRRKLFKNSRK